MRVPLRMASGGEQAARTRQAQQPIKAARTASANVRAVVLVAFGMASITCLWDSGGSRSGFQNVDAAARWRSSGEVSASATIASSFASAVVWPC